MQDIRKAIKKMQLLVKYRYLYTNLVAGKKEPKEDWMKRMLVECGHDPEGCKIMDFDEFIDKYNTLK